MIATWPLIWSFDSENDQRLKEFLDRADAAVDPEAPRRLHCSACRHPITSGEARISILGAHEHRCTNPHGITYDIGCFRNAPGCLEIGEAIEDFSWFAGYHWRVALCNHCQEHLGWSFASTARERFFGLILDRLID